jgi:hypothetical protein
VLILRKLFSRRHKVGLNLTYISKKANRKIRDKGASEYFQYITSISNVGHCVPSVDKFKSDYGESYYEKFLEDRFEFICRELLKELDDLIS